MNKEDLQLIKDYANSPNLSPELQFALRRAVNELEKLVRDTFTLKVVVNRRGKLLVIEEFPHDEIHEGLHELIPELEDGEYNVEPGTYYAKCILETVDTSYGLSPDYNIQLSIVEFIKA
jgi:hypothetical protein